MSKKKPSENEAMSASSSFSSPRKPEIRRDSVFNRLVIFSPARSRRPSDFKSAAPPNPHPNPPSCPFCLGREHDCAPEIFRMPYRSVNWKIRVIENLYPVLCRDLEPPAEGRRIFDDGVCGVGKCAEVGFGFHNVVIETPSHSVHLSDLSLLEFGEVVLAYWERVRQLANYGSLEYVQVFKNHGASAGASMTHSHSQIIGLPLVPPTVSARLDSLKEVYDRFGKCGLCEARTEDILINESEHFFAIVPFAASFPFEVWIIPRKHTPYFQDLDELEVVEFGGLLRLLLRKLLKQLNDPPYNFMIHNSPFHLPASHLPCSHWFLQIVPQLNVVGGFEMGSGCYINPVFPEDAAKVLREVDCAIH